nr:uncharacterized protein LOC123002501 [Drosophila takahashii]
MRTLEEESLTKCKAIIRKMKRAMQKQRNINMDVKDGTAELTELFDVIESYRASWKKAEGEKIKEMSKAIPKTLKIVDTPLSSTQMRAAASPALQDSSKKARDKESNNGFQTVTNKKRKKYPKSDDRNLKRDVNGEKKDKPRTRVRSRPDAVLVRLTEGKSYAEVLRDLRNSVKPENDVSNILSIRKTKSGDMLLELSRGSKAELLCETIKTRLKGDATVRTMKQQTKLEIRDIDSITEESEIISAIKTGIGDTTEEIKIHLTGVNSSEQRRAFVTLTTEDAAKILKDPRIRIGWTLCRVKECIDTMRCYKCFGVGHTQRDCKGPDRRNLCIRCGEAGHKMKECKNPVRCCVCAAEERIELNHLPGTTKCHSGASKNRE